MVSNLSSEANKLEHSFSLKSDPTEATKKTITNAVQEFVILDWLE